MELLDLFTVYFSLSYMVLQTKEYFPENVLHLSSFEVSHLHVERLKRVESSLQRLLHQYGL